MKYWSRMAGILLVLAVASGDGIIHAQDPDSLPDHPPVATVRFENVWEAATPQDFVIIVRAIGGARYLSRNPTRPEQPQGRNPNLPDYNVEFTLSPQTQTRIFKLAQQANYFDGNFDYKKHQVASTGTKTLGYADPGRHFETTYNWSENKAIDELTSLFVGIAATMEHGRKLEYLRRFDRLGLEDELKAMEDAAQNHYLAELQIIAPILKSIANDSSILNIARQRAHRLLETSNKASQ